MGWGGQENIGSSHFPACQRKSFNCQLIPKPILMDSGKLAALFVLLLLTFWSSRAGLSLTQLCLLSHSLLCVTPYCMKPVASLGPTDQNTTSIRLPALLGNSAWFHTKATLYQSSGRDPETCSFHPLVPSNLAQYFICY